MDDKDNVKLSTSDLQILYEGLTQEDDGFRDALSDLGYEANKDELFSEQQRVKNRINYAMLGVHPIYRREVELAGMIDFNEQTFSLASDPDDIVLNFADMDPSYVAFLENQRRVYSTDDDDGTIPMSSVALKASLDLHPDKKDVPDIESVHLNVPNEPTTTSRKVLERAFTSSMVMMTHLQKQIKGHGFDSAYGMNKAHLLQHVASDQFNHSFNRSVTELEGIAKTAANDYSLN